MVNWYSVSLASTTIVVTGILLYVVVVYEFSGEFTTDIGPPEDMTIWRAQFFVRTSNSDLSHVDESFRADIVDRVGTDTDAYVKINEEHGEFWIDHPFDDREKGDSHIYDLRVPADFTVSDIEKLEIGMDSRDMWCFDWIQLLINERVIYDRQFDPNDPKCLDEEKLDASYTISRQGLRSSAVWKAYIPVPFPDIIPAQTFVKKIEAMTGHSLKAYDDDLDWRDGCHYTSFPSSLDRCVNVGGVDDDTIYVAIFLEEDRLFTSPSFSIRYDLTFSCEDGKIITTDSNYEENLDRSWFDVIVDLFSDTFDHWPPGVEFDVSGRAPFQTSPVGSTSFCPEITVQENGDVHFDFNLQRIFGEFAT